jgi:hypothetical protein
MDLLKNTKKNTGRHETTEVLNKSSASHDDTPADTEHAKIDRRALELLQKNVARNFKKDIRYKNLLKVSPR